MEILPGNYAKISLKRTDACAKCGACAPSGEDMTVIAYNPDGARISQRVSLSLEAKYFLSAALILYGMPLAALLAGAAAGYYGSIYLHCGQFSPVIGLLAGFFAMFAAYPPIRAIDKKIKKALYIPIAHIDI